MHSFSELVKRFEKRLSKEAIFSKQPTNLYEPCEYLFSLSAKRVRPALCLMGNELFGDIHDDAWHAANAIELFHNFTLVHDDIMDNAPLRRGNQTIHDKYGLTTGILSGDIICIYAYKELAKVKNSLPDVLGLFNKTAIEVCEGQQLDMDFERRDDVNIDEYINMIALKTSVLLACSLKIGAIIGGASEDDADLLYQFGKNVGIAFQLQDDYLDAFGDTKDVGKQNGGDIKANKKTYLLLKAIEQADKKQLKKIKKLLKASSDDKVESMLELYKATEVDTMCKNIMQEYSSKAFENLEAINVADENKKPLKELASYLLNREK